MKPVESFEAGADEADRAMLGAGLARGDASSVWSESTTSTGSGSFRFLSMLFILVFSFPSGHGDGDFVRSLYLTYLSRETNGRSLAARSSRVTTFLDAQLHVGNEAFCEARCFAIRPAHFWRWTSRSCGSNPVFGLSTWKTCTNFGRYSGYRAYNP